MIRNSVLRFRIVGRGFCFLHKSVWTMPASRLAAVATIEQIASGEHKLSVFKIVVLAFDKCRGLIHLRVLADGAGLFVS
jgi:hypothetical protein